MPRDPQLAFPFRAWGGKRKGAGRPPKRNTAGVSHLRRPSLSHRHAVHITLRIASGVPSLRNDRLFGAVRFALAAGRERFGFRLVHFSVQSDHLHLIAEAQDSRALALGMQGLSVRVARAVNMRPVRPVRPVRQRAYGGMGRSVPLPGSILADSVVGGKGWDGLADAVVE